MVEFARPLRGSELLLARGGQPALVAAEVRGPLTALALQQAAFRVQRRYPALRTRVLLTPSSSRAPCVEFCEAHVGDVAFEEIRLQDGISNANGASWQRVLEHELNRTLGPGVDQALRVVWLPGIQPGGHVFLSTRGALVDGTSLLLIIHDLLEESTKPVGKRADAYALEPSPPSPAFLDTFPPSLGDCVRAKLDRGWFRESPTADDDAWSLPDANRLSTVGHLTTRTSFAVGKTESARIRAACDAQGTTVSGAALAAAEFAWMRLRTELGRRAPAPNERLRLELTMDFDCRRARPASHSPDVGMLTGMAEVGMDVAADIPFWQLARALSDRSNLQFRRRIPLLFHQTLDGSLEIASELHAFGFHGGATSGSSQALRFANLGPYPYPTRLGALELVQLYSASPAVPFGPRLSLHLHELSARTFWSLSAAQPACDESAAARLLPQIVQLVDDCAEAPFDRLALCKYAAGLSAP